MSRHALTDREWTCLKLHLPERCTDRPPKEHRTIIDALLWLSRTGAPWRDLPERYSPWRTVATRFYRWTRSGLWDRILAALRHVADAAGGIDWEVHMVDGTSVRAHRCAAGGKGGRLRQALGRSRGGFGSKLHIRCDRRGRPMAFVLTPGERHEQTAFGELMRQGALKRPGPGRPRLRPRANVGDKGYTGRPVRGDCAGAGSLLSSRSLRPRRRHG